MLSGNMSIRRAVLTRIGGFDERLGRRRREDWLLGLRAIEAGVPLCYEAGAVADHEFSLPSGRRLAAAHQEGLGDALLCRLYPGIEAVLDPWGALGRRRRVAVALLGLLARRPAAAGALLDVLERAKLRDHWGRCFNAMQLSSYRRGRREGSAGLPPALRVEPPQVDAAAAGPLPAPRPYAVPFDLQLPGSAQVRITPGYGRWNRSVAVAAASAEIRARNARPAPAERGLPLPLAAFGPAHRRGEDRRVRAAGAPARRLDALRHWEAIDRIVREAGTDHVVTAMPGAMVSVRWLERVAEAVDGEDVALWLGVTPVRPEPPAVPLLRRRALHPERFANVDGPFHFMVFHRRRYAELGGLTPALGRLGDHAPGLDLAERALDAGLVVGHLRLRGLSLLERPSGIRARREWQMQRSRGGLFATVGSPGLSRSAAVARGLLPLVEDARRRRYPRHVAAARMVAYAAGARAATR
jgi:hypothetical protein